MKKYLFICTLCLCGLNGFPQAPSNISNNIKHIIDLFERNNGQELSKYVAYPLSTIWPMEISTPEQFTKYFPMLFDSIIKKKLRAYNDSVIFFHNSSYGLVGGVFDGDLWFAEDGKLRTINYETEAVKKEERNLKLQAQKKVYPSVSDWQNDMLMMYQGKNLIILLYRTGKGLRYVSWTNGHKVSEKPDLILDNGNEEPGGSMGNYFVTFTNGKWEYKFDIIPCSGNNDCGRLTLSYNGGEKENWDLSAYYP